MIENFKDSIKQANNLTWVILTITFTMLIINPIEQKEFPLLGVKIAIERTLIIVPSMILFLTTIRGILIRNAKFICENMEKPKDINLLKEFVISYPLHEFLRWRSKEYKSLVFLTIFQSIVDCFPSIAIITYPFILESSHYDVLPIYKVILEGIGLLTGLVGVNNYSILRSKIFEPLVGKIQTPD